MRAWHFLRILFGAHDAFRIRHLPRCGCLAPCFGEQAAEKGKSEGTDATLLRATPPMRMVDSGRTLPRFFSDFRCDAEGLFQQPARA
ncbi:hypothetical protein [Siccirubricoccus phaeus]|uniref:hypothetical protein n=1 Tax=Siccirubricoccus phaeus TaxID=2595053 RepID=UPI00165C1336|nr:hypothetical protein [Siccirubricoccus phaeus]